MASKTNNEITFYDEPRRMKVGTSASGQDVTVGFFVEKETGDIICRFYHELNDVEEYPNFVHEYAEAFRPVEEDMKMQLKKLRRAWVKYFKTYDEDISVRAKIEYDDADKWMVFGFTNGRRPIWMKVVKQDGKDSIWFRWWGSVLSGDVLDLNTLITEIRTKDFWRGAAINIWKARYGEPEEPVSWKRKSSDDDTETATVSMKKVKE